MPLPNVARTMLLNRANLYFLPDDKELARPTPTPPPTYLRASSSSQPSSSLNFTGLHTTLQSIQEEKAPLQAYIQVEDTALHDFIQERHDELRRMIASQNQCFQDFRDCLETWPDWYISQPHPPSYPPSPFF